MHIHIYVYLHIYVENTYTHTHIRRSGGAEYNLKRLSRRLLPRDRSLQLEIFLFSFLSQGYGVCLNTNQ